MRSALSIVFLAAFAASAWALPMESVVKIFAVKSVPDYFIPWNDTPPSEGTASGCVIKGKRILTNAHAVSDQTFVMVRKQSSPKKFIARVLTMGHECDLALLTVEDQSFFEDLKPIEMQDEAPDLNTTVVVLGYPIGGDAVSITAGVVSRIEALTYSHSFAQLLAIQIDAAINPGNSGGPVVHNDKLAGIAFQGFQSANNIGYIIPVPIIRHFLKDVDDDQKYDGFCDLSLNTQRMESDQLRAFKGMAPDQTGVLIVDLEPLSQAAAKLQAGDVLLAFEGVPIANDSTVPFRQGERVHYSYLVSGKFIGETARAKILRNGQVLDVDLKMEAAPSLVPRLQYDVKPSYFVQAGMVFTPLTQNYLTRWGGNWYSTCPRKLLNLFEEGKLTKPGEQVVVLSQVLSDEVNVGYTEARSVQVLKVNGEPVLNLKDLARRMEANTNKYLTLDLENHYQITLETRLAQESTARILKKYRISAAQSADLK